MSFLRVEKLSFQYPHQKSAALKNFNAEIAEKKITGILGPNGSGKSTLFKVLSTQITQFEGEVWLNGKSLAGNPQQIRKILGVTFQSPSVDPMLTVEENLYIQAALYKINEKKSRVDSALQDFGLSSRRKERVKTLSGGLKRRVELAKSLLHEPPFLLMDEPTTGLDPKARFDFWQILQKLKKKSTIVVTTHLMEEAELCDELIFLSDGKEMASGTPKSLQQKHPFEKLRLRLDSNHPDSPLIFKKLQNFESYHEEAGEIVVQEKNCRNDLQSLAASAAVEELRWGKSNLADIYLKLTGNRLES